MESKGFFRIPLQKLKTGHYKLPVKVNGKTGHFILDTGASNSCIGFASIDRFLMHAEESKVKAAGAGANNMMTQIANNNTFSIGKKSKISMTFVLFDLSHVNSALSQVLEPPVQGILGADFLKESRAVIDYGRNVLFIK